MDYGVMKLKEHTERKAQDQEHELAIAKMETQEILKEESQGLERRYEFMKNVKGAICFRSNAERLEKIKEWYPITYRTLEKYLPNMIYYPDDLPESVICFANQFLKTTILPADLLALTFI